MTKKVLDKTDIELLNIEAECIAYLEYNDKVGGEPFALSEGCPYVEDITAMYRECIIKGVTWDVLLGVKGFRFDIVQKQ